MAIKYDPITPNMTVAEREIVILKALLQYPNFPVIAGKLDCRLVLIQTVAGAYGIMRTFLSEPKFDMIMARLENGISSKRIARELSMPLKTIERVEEHKKLAESIRMRSGANTGLADVWLVEARKEATASASQAPNARRKHAESERSDADYMKNCKALFDHAGVRCFEPKRSAMSDLPASKPESAAVRTTRKDDKTRAHPSRKKSSVARSSKREANHPEPC